MLWGENSKTKVYSRKEKPAGVRRKKLRSDRFTSDTHVDLPAPELELVRRSCTP